MGSAHICSVSEKKIADKNEFSLETLKLQGGKNLTLSINAGILQMLVDNIYERSVGFPKRLHNTLLYSQHTINLAETNFKLPVRTDFDRFWLCIGGYFLRCFSYLVKIWNGLSLSQTPKSSKQDISECNLSFTLHPPPCFWLSCNSPW